MWLGKDSNLSSDIMFKELFSASRYLFSRSPSGKKMLFCFSWDELLGGENTDPNDTRWCALSGLRSCNCLGADFGVVTVIGVSLPSFCAGVAGVSTTSLLQVLQIAVI